MSNAPSSFLSFGLVGWLGFTALQHNIFYIAPVSVVNVRMSAHAGLVGRATLHPRTVGEFSSPHSTGGVCRVRRGQTILHSRAVGIFYPPPNPQGE